MKTILVTGGTGTLGRQLVPLLVKTGSKVRVLSRKERATENNVEYVTGDLATGEGVDAAVKGVDVIVHCAGSSKGDEVKTRHLTEAALQAGRPHLVFISVVGADQPSYAYFKSKLLSEEVVTASGLPWTTLRATQFHDLILVVMNALAKLPVMLAPSGFNFQPIDSGEVAARMAELALGEPAGLVADIGGPQVLSFKEMAREYLRATGKHRLVMPLPLFGKSARIVKAGSVLAPDHAYGRRTWAEFLGERSALPQKANTLSSESR
ncbi:MAG: SDR family oxidoreductase [Chloroflexi bacterium]|nr:SDR family oxidoreductase [Chloroflexota bacterium]OJV96618.1 MAG: NmrA family transcriptional regulator [Chloroflexi bacterium 54-19]